MSTNHFLWSMFNLNAVLKKEEDNWLNSLQFIPSKNKRSNGHIAHLSTLPVPSKEQV